MKAGREEGALQNSVTGMQEYPKTIHGKTSCVQIDNSQEAL